MQTTTILDLIRILLSWPPVGAIVFFFFVYKFGGSIKIFLETHELTGGRTG